MGYEADDWLALPVALAPELRSESLDGWLARRLPNG